VQIDESIRLFNPVLPLVWSQWLEASGMIPLLTPCWVQKGIKTANISATSFNTIDLYSLHYSLLFSGPRSVRTSCYYNQCPFVDVATTATPLNSWFKAATSHLAPLDTTMGFSLVPSALALTSTLAFS